MKSITVGCALLANAIGAQMEGYKTIETFMQHKVSIPYCYMFKQEEAAAHMKWYHKNYAGRGQDRVIT